MAGYFQPLIFIPDIETIPATTPKRYRQFENLIGIIDFSEIFIKNSKNIRVQSTTWSEYKNHNTLKCLVCVASNLPPPVGGNQKFCWRDFFIRL